jgi:hypothetical protein
LDGDVPLQQRTAALQLTKRPFSLHSKSLHKLVKFMAGVRDEE